MVAKKFVRIALGISGGVDSSVAALILKRKGLDVQGVFMRNWDVSDETGKCSVNKDLEDAEKTCSKLGIPLHEVNFSKEYWNFVFSDFIEQYQMGKTPNPDILCNKFIKFNQFVNYSLNRLGADAIATGHYAQTSFGPFLEAFDNQQGVRLLKAVDSFKDQTLFLHQVHQEALQKTMFPLGKFKKAQVKSIARENNLMHVLNKKESTGICFVGKRNFSQFISEYIPDRPGVFVDIDSGKVVGSHKGIHYWTIGQRCRIGGNPDRCFVARLIPETQEVQVAFGANHPVLWSQHITTSRAHWIHSEPEILREGGVLDCDFRFQHTDPLLPCKVMLKDNDSLLIKLDKPLFAITSGQFAVLYKGNECLGGAQIKNSAPSFFSQYCLDNKLNYNFQSHKTHDFCNK
ncbi:mitochondrial tRNA-specific 2-thiouridylase 1 [Macrosteles quadrilineatus]|uniref:mitochondrial tRNA-specific 2-thiouridylase 1 n=1 Tax=Macrosteles quadrilineatus TaxID=74068 RepID=UPI0023E104F9|nr:mitochondrial tRNA-specific 2-thiouridylase 1 [Macrosteles quadrilineatus]